MSLALDPELNVRVFGGESPGSLRAAARWLRRPDAEAPGEAADAEAPAAMRHALVEGRGLDTPEVPAAALRAGLGFEASTRRLWLYGAPAAFAAFVAELGAVDPRLAGELGAALAAHADALERPRPARVMGILNVTPDSFSDGGLWLDPEAAVARGLELLEAGADMLDIGGESTRPGAEEVPVEEELRRVLPVLERLRPLARVPISIDTRKAAVARAALEAGADGINDISGLAFDPALAEVVAAHPRAFLVLMHSRSRPADERYSTEWEPGARPEYEDVVADTLRWLRRQAGWAVERGVPPGRIWIDPGFGFGKTFAQNVELLRRLEEYLSTGCPVLVGVSRKSSIGKLQAGAPAGERLEGSLAGAAWAVLHGAAAVRVHDVRETVRLLRVLDVLRDATPLPS